eukprot:CAMPEP_0179851412 /NCGR_PEP_ID=MMETSP0982-20121206/8236_1 /TAXON_ID=483367 /ORGANISM="non described non described, Strain CCMP 2436" /LENGTH=159 /DNA_ID=CAMNT_0021736929 /DNA_START=558 /DNA_END=1037 /DNA_ORIENTATION=-
MVEKRSPHSSHAYGFSPVCTRSCTVVVQLGERLAAQLARVRLLARVHCPRMLLLLAGEQSRELLLLAGELSRSVLLLLAGEPSRVIQFLAGKPSRVLLRLEPLSGRLNCRHLGLRGALRLGLLGRVVECKHFLIEDLAGGADAVDLVPVIMMRFALLTA